MILSVGEELLLSEFRKERVVNLSIHNQYGFLLGDTAEGTDDRRIMQAECYHLAQYTKDLSPYALTVYSQIDVTALNGGRKKHVENNPGKTFVFHRAKEYLPYDPETMRVEPGARKLGNSDIDLINADYSQLVVIGKHGVVTAGDSGKRLVRHLRENGRDVILGSGLYAHVPACVPSSLKYFAEAGFTVYAVTDKIICHPAYERERETKEQVLKKYDQRIRLITSDIVMAMAKLSVQ